MGRVAPKRSAIACAATSKEPMCGVSSSTPLPRASAAASSASFSKRTRGRIGSPGLRIHKYGSSMTMRPAEAMAGFHCAGPKPACAALAAMRRR
jgi:hypothetical protein